MKGEGQITVTCPDCGSDLTIDVATGTVLFHKASPDKGEPKKDFDDLLAGLDDSRNRAEEIFQREVTAFKDRDRLLEEKFQEAMKKAEESPDDEPPVRPWDLD